MAYSISTPPALVAQRLGTTNGKVWVYNTTDTEATVVVNNYISNATALGMSAGDRVILTDTTSNLTTDLTVSSWTNGTAVGAVGDAVEPVGETSILMDDAGTGAIIVGDIVTFDNDPDAEYRVTTGDADISAGAGSIVITPGLATATTQGTKITVKQDVLNLKGRTEVLTAATTLTAEDSGRTFFLHLAAGFVTTLPAPALGLKFRFVLSLAITGDHTIVTASSANVIQGNVTVAGVVVLGANEDTISFVDTAEQLGDWVEVESDGTNWYVSGQASTSGGITLTAS